METRLLCLLLGKKEELMMKNVLIMDIEDQEDVWKVVEKCQLIFHPEIAPNGVFDKEKFWRKKARKPFMLVLDRNLFSALIHICEKGKLKDEKEQQLIGFIMTWAAMNGVNISSGNAVMEYATSVSDLEQAEIEIGKFLKIIDSYPAQMWFSLASGERESLPVCNFDGIKAENITAQYSEGCDSFMNALAATIHMVVLFRDRNISKYDKTMHFFEWVYDYSQVSNDVLTYAILMLTNQEGVKAPKGANKEKYEDVLKGCENQTWDLSYIMNIKRLNHKKCPLDNETVANLRFLIGIRHEIEHQMTNRIDEYLSAKLQAAAINFDYYITQLFGVKFSINDKLSLAIQFSPLSPEQKDELINNEHIISNVKNFVT